MFKFTVPTIAAIMLIGSVGSADAQHRRHGYSGHHWNHAPYHNRHRGRNVAPYIAGAIGAAIIGGIIYDQYGRRCFREVVGYDRYGDPITRRVCN